MKQSAAGEVRLKKREGGFSANKYPDAYGYSIGYGHFIKPGESFGTITQAQGEQLYKNDIAPIEASINNSVTVPLTQAQFDSLVSFTYNEGIAAFEGSTLLAKLNAGDYAGAKAEFARWNISSGQVNPALVARRAQEAQAFA